MAGITGQPPLKRDGFFLKIDPATDRSIQDSNTPTQGKALGRNQPLTINNSVAKIRNRDLHYLAFDGTDDYIDVGISGPGDLFASASLEWSIGCWYQTDVVNQTGMLIGRGGGTGGSATYGLYAASTGLMCKVRGTTITLANAILALDGDWHMAFTTWDGSSFKTYLDDRTPTSHNAGGASLQEYNILLGATSTGTSNLYEGNIGQMFIYDKALSDERIIQLYNKTKRRYTQNTINTSAALSSYSQNNSNVVTNNLIPTSSLTLALEAGTLDSFGGTDKWYDLSPSGVTASLYQGMEITWRDNGYYFDLDGATMYASLDTLVYGGGNGTISEMTVLAWTRTTFNSGTPGTWANGNWAILDFDRSDVFSFAMNDSGEVQMSGRPGNAGGIGSGTYFDIVGSGSYNDGNWHLVGWTYSVANQEIIMYADGAVDKTFTANGSMSALGAGTTRYGIVGDGSEAGSPGSNQNNIFYDGDIGAIYFWDNATLSSGSIQDIYNNTKARYGL